MSAIRKIQLPTNKPKTSYIDRQRIGYRNKMVKVTLPTIKFRDVPESPDARK